MIAGFVPLNLRGPIDLVRRRAPITFWTTVPKASVHKDANPGLSENEIWISEKLLFSSPARDRVGSEYLYEFQLRRLVAM